jgi:hypothetical protein
LRILIRNDAFDEPEEHFFVTLANATGGASLGVQRTVQVSIRDNDVGGSLSFSGATFSVSETSCVATILVKRSGGPARDSEQAPEV